MTKKHYEFIFHLNHCACISENPEKCKYYRRAFTENKCDFLSKGERFGKLIEDLRKELTDDSGLEPWDKRYTENEINAMRGTCGHMTAVSNAERVANNNMAKRICALSWEELGFKGACRISKEESSDRRRVKLCTLSENDRNEKNCGYYSSKIKNGECDCSFYTFRFRGAMGKCDNYDAKIEAFYAYIKEIGKYPKKLKPRRLRLRTY